MLSDALTWLSDTQASAAVMGETVTYRRGRTDITVTVVRQRNAYQSLAIADGRANLMVVPQDWTVRPAEIDFGDGPEEPQDGDRIVTAAGELYELAPRDGEPSHRLVDLGAAWRLRTVRES